MHDGAFVSSYGVGAQFQRGFDVIDRGFTGCGVEGASFEDDVGASAFDPLANVSRRRMRRLRGPMTIQNGQGVQPIRVDEPAGATGGDTREAPADVVAAPEFGLFGDEQA